MRPTRCRLSLACGTKITSVISLCAPVAQLDRAADFESVGRGFEPLRARQLKSADYKHTIAAIWIFLTLVYIMESKSLLASLLR